ncbi:beta-glucosidase [Lichenibacterium dinghuense]|uniref:beta-glucosidase n=1 Tax=Lichenibacterium dinghuense TaxID=2895977 RepID=UPI001F354478|nr:beta-glucosidase [Lichenibacterium sp. 6Y81]
MERDGAETGTSRAALALRSFAMGGFEGATMVLDTGRRVDAVAGSRHDAAAVLDYRLLAATGVRTARDGFRWHLIEREPGRYDWSSVLPQVRAAAEAGVEVIWDLCHFGLPDGADPWSPALPGRFAAFARAAARLLREEGDGVPLWCPVNEISYWAYAGGERGHFAPCARGRGADWKRRLVRLCVAASRALREVDPRARLVHADPVIHIAAGGEADREIAERHRLSMFEGWDMIAGRREPDLGGAPDLLDVVGVNFYPDNQWVHGGPRLRPGMAGHRPLRRILHEVHARYGRPIVVTETGAEADEGPDWLRGVGVELAAAREGGVPVAGCCVYPAMDYPGWTDDRHCRCGPIAASPDWSERWIDPAMAEAVGDLAQAGAVRPGAPPPDGAAPGAVPEGRLSTGAGRCA